MCVCHFFCISFHIFRRWRRRRWQQFLLHFLTFEIFAVAIELPLWRVFVFVPFCGYYIVICLFSFDVTWTNDRTSKSINMHTCIRRLTCARSIVSEWVCVMKRCRIERWHIQYSFGYYHKRRDKTTKIIWPNIFALPQPNTSHSYTVDLWPGSNKWMNEWIIIISKHYIYIRSTLVNECECARTILSIHITAVSCNSIWTQNTQTHTRAHARTHSEFRHID